LQEAVAGTHSVYRLTYKSSAIGGATRVLVRKLEKAGSFTMVSSSKLTANRRNARLSTGPRTAAGKALSSRNAFRHGLLAVQVILPDENAAEFDEFRDRVTADRSPVGEIEAILVERIVFASWRLRRVARIEAAAARAQMDPGFGVAENERFEDRVYWAMVRDSNSGNLLERVRRYEVTLERSFLSALHELERLQAGRAGEPTSIPAVIDVHVNSAE